MDRLISSLAKTMDKVLSGIQSIEEEMQSPRVMRVGHVRVSLMSNGLMIFSYKNAKYEGQRITNHYPGGSAPLTDNYDVPTSLDYVNWRITPLMSPSTEIIHSMNNKALSTFRLITPNQRTTLENYCELRSLKEKHERLASLLEKVFEEQW